MPVPSSFRGRRARRGNALLLALILVAILGVVGLAIVQRASSESEAAGAKKLHDSTVNCADAARDLLMSQFRAYGVTPSELTLQSTVGNLQMTTGHFDNNGVSVKSVEPVATNKPSWVNGDMANRLISGRGQGSGGGGGLGGRLYRMSVVCKSPSPNGGADRVAEVEYMVRFGL